jgi:hypothetical protein
LKLKPSIAIVLSGALWLVIGLFLMIKGLHLLILAAHPIQIVKTPVILPHLAARLGGEQEGVLVLIAIGLFVGLIKGRFVLVKSVKRVVQRLYSLPSPIRIQEMYSWSYLLLIAGMVGLGVGIRLIALPADIHGLIDVAIGSALINGAMIYFRFAVTNNVSLDKAEVRVQKSDEKKQN